MTKKIKVLGICGSLRESSLNKLFLECMQLLCPENVDFEIYSQLKRIPIFDPDNQETDDVNVSHWRKSIAQADVILLASPEYAHGITGVIKNALDWIVSSGEFTNKLISFPNIAIRTDLAYLQLIEVLNVMGAVVLDNCSPQATLDKPYIKFDMNKEQVLKQTDIRNRLELLWTNINSHFYL